MSDSWEGECEMRRLHVYEENTTHYLNRPDTVTLYEVRDRGEQVPEILMIREREFRNDRIGKAEKREYINSLHQVGVISVEAYVSRFGKRL